jgi:integrase
VWYVRRGYGPRIRIKSEYDSPAFWQEYRAALEGAPKPAKAAKAQTLEWALDRYRASSAWAGLSNATRRQRENVYHAVIKTAGHELLRAITSETIRAGRERRKATPHAANNFLKAMRGFFAWAVEAGLVAADPCKGIKLLAGKNDAEGFHVWSQEELDRFEARWGIGTRERLAFDLLLYTGLRRGDAVRVGKQHVRDGVITIRTEKHRRGKPGALISIPILPPVAASIAATKTGDLTYLITEWGQPWVKESFGNWFKEACRKAGCPGSAHGLRKAGATRAAERGASERQLMAIYGWETGKMAQHYTRAADRAKLAREAAQLLLPAQSMNENRPHLGPGAGASANNGNKSTGNFLTGAQERNVIFRFGQLHHVPNSMADVYTEPSPKLPRSCHAGRSSKPDSPDDSRPDVNIRAVMGLLARPMLGSGGCQPSGQPER